MAAIVCDVFSQKCKRVVWKACKKGFSYVQCLLAWPHSMYPCGMLACLVPFLFCLPSFLTACGGATEKPCLRSVECGMCGLPGMWLEHEREGCSDWLPAGPLSGRHQSSVCQSLFLWSAPGLEPETHWIKAEDTLPTFCIAVKTNSGDQVCACGGWGVVWADGLLFNGLFCPLVAFLGAIIFPPDCMTLL